MRGVSACGVVCLVVFFSVSCVDPESELIQATNRRDIRALEAALAAGATPADKVKGLGLASMAGATEIVGALLKAGADPQQGLAHAAGEGHLEVVRLLLGAGADPSQPGAFDLATMSDDPAIMGIFLERWPASGDPPDLEDALMTAAQLGKLKATSFLLGRGADPTKRDLSGRTALDEARKSKQWGVVELLIKARKAPTEGR